MKYLEELGVLRLLLDCLQGSQSIDTIQARNYYIQIEDTDFLSVIENPHIKRVISFIHYQKINEGKFPKKGDVLSRFEDDLEVLQVIEEAESHDITYSIVVSTVERALQAKALVRLVREVTRNLDNPEVSIEDLYEQGRQILQIHKGTTIRMGIDFMSEDRLYLMEDSERMYIPAGIRAIDEMLPFKGLRYQWLVVFAAGPGFGKSLTLQNLALSHYLQGKTVLYFTLEMLEREVQQRLDTILLAALMEITDGGVEKLVDEDLLKSLKKIIPKKEDLIKAADIITPALLRENIDWIRETLQFLRLGLVTVNPYQFLRIFYFPPNELSPQKLSDLIQRFTEHYKTNVDTVIVDYADLMKPPVKRDSRWEEIADIFESLKRVAVTNNVLLLTATQIGKKAMFKVNQTQADLYGSSEKTFNADYIFNLTRSAEAYKNSNDAIGVIATKHRHGVTTATRSMRVIRRVLMMDAGLLARMLVKGFSEHPTVCQSPFLEKLPYMLEAASHVESVKELVDWVMKQVPSEVKSDDTCYRFIKDVVEKFLQSKVIGKPYNNTNGEQNTNEVKSEPSPEIPNVEKAAKDVINKAIT